MAFWKNHWSGSLYASGQTRLAALPYWCNGRLASCTLSSSTSSSGSAMHGMDATFIVSDPGNPLFSNGMLYHTSRLGRSSWVLCRSWLPMQMGFPRALVPNNGKIVSVDQEDITERNAHPRCHSICHPGFLFVFLSFLFSFMRVEYFSGVKSNCCCLLVKI